MKQAAKDEGALKSLAETLPQAVNLPAPFREKQADGGKCPTQSKEERSLRDPGLRVTGRFSSDSQRKTLMSTPTVRHLFLLSLKVT